jgi:5,5'-dehydrodivanillate O-demethylase
LISQEMNDLLTRVGPDTKMGKVLRHYWHPIAAVQELEEAATKPVRLMGEDLVLYKDLSGTYGLIDRFCPHRNADLSMGFVEQCGLRCSYHGWLLDHKGDCLEAPFEDTIDKEGRLRKNIKTTAYRVEAKAGLLWAYIGPEPAPLLPDWEAFSFPNGFAQIVFTEIPCNWLQCQENSCDPVHFEWTHNNWKTRLEGKMGPYAPRHLELEFEEDEFGFVYRRLREGMDRNSPQWIDGRMALWPNCFFLGTHFEYRVPVDDETTLSVLWAFRRVPKESEPFVQQSIPYWYGPLKDKAGRWITDYVMNQDFVAWASQGRIANRTREHLGQSDGGVKMMRRQMLKDVEAVEAGRDPKGVIRDPARNHAIRLPMTERHKQIDGQSMAELLADAELGQVVKTFMLQYGQPEQVALAYEQAMGFAFDRGSYVRT